MTYEEIKRVADKLDEGDEIEIDAERLPKPRKLIVTLRHVGDRGYVEIYTTSGKVRPRGRGLAGFEGGRISEAYGDWLYQPTPMQQIRRITSLRLIRRASSRN